MMDTTVLTDYLTKIAGTNPHLEAIEASVAAKLPLYLKSGYSLEEVNLLNQRFFLALENKHKETSTPGVYAKQFDQLRKFVDGNIALVIEDLPSFARNRLLRMGVPFIVPGRQMFLPFMALDLRENFPKVEPASDKLTAAAQVVLLFHLQKRNLEQLSLREIANLLGYSAMTLSKVAQEFKQAQVCKLETLGRTLHLRFMGDGKRELWERALPLLRSPVKAKHWVRWYHRPERMVTAGLTVLAKHTMIQDDNIPTYAMDEKELRQGLKAERLIRCDEPDEAMGVIEAWSYDPNILADGNEVDRLSLYLSLKDNGDERVRMALNEYLESMQW